MGSVSFDADVLIGFLRPRDAHHARARQTLAEHHDDAKVIAASVYSEILVEPAKAGRADEVDAFLADLGVQVVAIDRAIARDAADLRARHRSLALPDAMALAVARHRGIPLITFDEKLQRIL